MSRILSVVLSLLFLFSSLANAEKNKVKIYQETVNGFTVYFVDIGHGNEMGLVYYVPFGHLHDPKDLAGRAHMFEHMIFAGSQKYPGFHTLGNKKVELGLSQNAGTGNTFTQYVTSGNEKNGKEMMDYMLAPLAGLEWNQSTFENEKGNVIDEVVNQIGKRGGRALSDLVQMYSLNPDHPWSTYRLGTREGLMAMTLDHLRETIYTNYTRENLKFIVSGNFSSGAFSREQVGLWLNELLQDSSALQQKESFQATRPPLNEPVIPALRAPASKSVRVLVNDETDKMLEIQFDAVLPENFDVLTLELLEDYLNLSIPGGLMNYLSQEVGLVGDAYFHSDIVNGRIIFSFVSQLTDKGFASQKELGVAVWRALGEVARYGIDPSVLEKLKLRNVHQLDKVFRSPKKINNFSYHLLQKGAEKLMTSDYGQAYEGISSEDVQKMVQQLMSPRNALLGILGPAVEGKLDPIFDRQVKVVDNSDWEAEFIEAFSGQGQQRLFSPHLNEISLEFRSSSVAVNPKSVELKTPSDQIRSVHGGWVDDVDGSFLGHLTLAKLDDLTKGAIALYREAFVDRYVSEMSYLSMMGVELDFGLKDQFVPSGFEVFVDGNIGHIKSTLKWFEKAWREFSPTEKELQKVFGELKDKVKYNDKREFSAIVAVEELIKNLNAASSKDRQVIEAISTSDLLKNPKKLKSIVLASMKGSKKDLVFVGAFSDSDKGELASLVGGMSPNKLSEEQINALENQFKNINQSEEGHQLFTEGRDQKALGLARAYMAGPVDNVKEYAATFVIGEALGHEISNLIRSEWSLGYIHTASPVRVNLERLYLVLYGQTETPDQRDKVVEGWNLTLEKLREGKLVADDFKEVKQGLVASLRKAPASAKDYAKLLLAGLAVRGKTNGVELLISAIEELSYQDILMVAEKYFGQNAPYYELVLGDVSVKKKTSVGEIVRALVEMDKAFVLVNSNWMKAQDSSEGVEVSLPSVIGASVRATHYHNMYLQLQVLESLSAKVAGYNWESFVGELLSDDPAGYELAFAIEKLSEELQKSLEKVSSQFFNVNAGTLNQLDPMFSDGIQNESSGGQVTVNFNFEDISVLRKIYHQLVGRIEDILDRAVETFIGKMSDLSLKNRDQVKEKYDKVLKAQQELLEIHGCGESLLGSQWEIQH